ncbi:MAG: S-layer homology domain-containing protein [Clostridia bacterium]|nr:S-layer homology domain-containing protein [Clostridia bacterium]
MKKTLALGITIIFLICTALTSFAAPAGAPAVTVKDAANDIVNVSGTTDATEYVTLMILNPGKTESDINFADPTTLGDSVQYISTYWAEGSEYNFDVPMYGSSGGVYKVIVTAGNTKYPTPVTIEYYFSSEKKAIIPLINASKTNVAEIEKYLKGWTVDTTNHNGAFTLNSLADDKLYVNGDKTKIAEVIQKRLQTVGDFDPQNVNTFADYLKISAILGAYNTGKSELLFTDNSIDYTAELLLDGTTELDDYINKLSEDGRTYVNRELVSSAPYYTVEEVKSKFRELVAFYGIKNHKEAGYGHMAHYFDAYTDVYNKYYFNLSLLTDSNEISVYYGIYNSTYGNLTELASVFNLLVAPVVEEDSNNSSPSYGGGGGGGGYTPPPVTDKEETNYITPTSFFLDLETVEWAEESIIALADRGIVSGRGNNNFAPNDYVTRAEYLKMLLGALELVDGSTNVPFTDIAADHWAREFIAAAVNGGITSGVSATEFAPEGAVTREQAATFAARAMNKKGAALEPDSNTFADDAYVSDWAKTSVNSLKKAGILSGSGNNMVNPKNNLTRAEAAKIIYGIMNSMGMIENIAK